jgi:hypothetical protein
LNGDLSWIRADHWLSHRAKPDCWQQTSRCAGGGRAAVMIGPPPLAHPRGRGSAGRRARAGWGRAAGCCLREEAVARGQWVRGWAPCTATLAVRPAPPPHPQPPPPPMKLMWSSISMRSPAEKPGFMPPAALVMSALWQPRYLAMRMGRMTSSGGGCGGVCAGVRGGRGLGAGQTPPERQPTQPAPWEVAKHPHTGSRPSPHKGPATRGRASPPLPSRSPPHPWGGPRSSGSAPGARGRARPLRGGGGEEEVWGGRHWRGGGG